MCGDRPIHKLLRRKYAKGHTNPEQGTSRSTRVRGRYRQEGKFNLGLFPLPTCRKGLILRGRGFILQSSGNCLQMKEQVGCRERETKAGRPRKSPKGHEGPHWGSSWLGEMEKTDRTCGSPFRLQRAPTGSKEDTRAVSPSQWSQGTP